ncbi:SusC/RagA family TonB-linked outer membrane protein [Dysgonomonas capnocytophagoides]|uniref:SusC/RagA family TonB-linked outer membrane protein n=1 Tax=Dysgonomonas capnocytophagoides TaxID=45254 RepID=UPI00291FB5CE|nr:TonB-dependent receptor [Dysgonomonas capnocytophagoides]
MKQIQKSRWDYFSKAFMLMLVLTLSSSMFAQKKITGIVVDEKGESVIGASVSEKGTTSGTATDIDGKFSLEVKDGAVIVVSYLGFLTQEIIVNDRSDFHIIMKDNTEMLNEVVVVGYGVMRKKDLTGSLASVGAKSLKDKPVANIGEALQGQAAGVQVVNAGAPGSNVSIRIRGLGSINSTDPLLVIDGVPTDMPLNALNQNDVETIDILKDASATAIYGSRGANGVVLITTKKGKSGDGIISVSANWGIQDATSVPKMLNASQFASLHNDMMANNNRTQRPDFEDPTSWGKGTDWTDALLRTAAMQNYSVSYSGGTDKSNYYVSGSVFDQNGIVINTSYRRYTLQFNNESKVRPWLKFGNNVTLSHDTKKNGDYSILNTLASLPTQSIYNEDGTYSGPGTEAQYYGDLRNPIGTARLNNTTTKGYNVLGNLYGEASLFDKVTYKMTGGIDFKFWDENNFTPKYDWQPIPVVNSYRSEQSNKSLTYLWDNTLTYMDTFNEKHNLNVMIGSSAQNNTYNYSKASIQGFLSDSNNQLNNGLLDPTVGGSKNEWALLSFFGRVNYSFNDKYLLTATVRRDGTSRITKANRWGTFPSFSGAWRLSEESFYKRNNILSDIKIRMGYGVTGNQGVLDNYAAVTRLKTSQYVFNGTPVSTLYPLVMPNPDIKWETVKQGNIGFDASLFKQRINVTFDAYVKNTTDMLVSMVVPITTGYSDIYTPMINAGKVRNTGWELTVASQNIKGDFEWNTDFNISYNKNKIIKLNNNVSIYSGYQQHTVGLPVGSFYGWVTNGIFQNWNEVNSYAYQYQGTDAANGTAPGDIKFLDINNDGVVNDYDRTYIGNPTPAWNFSMTNSFSYRNFDMQVFLQGVAGNDIYNANRVTLEGMYTVRNQTKKVLNRWTGEGTSNSMPRAIYSDPNKNTRTSTRFIEDGSYLRLKNLTLGYTLPESLIKKASINSLRFYMSAQNLLTLTKYSGFDPEIQGGVDNSNYPLTRTISFGVDLKF